MLSFDPKKLDIRQLHNLVIGGVAPRPIALVSTQSSKGEDNLAPFSFFNAFSSNPPVVAFSPAKRGRDGTFKDTYNNLMATKECVVHIVNYNMVEQMNLSSTEYPAGVDEFIKSGFTKAPSSIVKPSRVLESPLHMECKLRQMISLGDSNGSGNMAICDVVQFHVNENFYKDGRIDVQSMDQVGRNGDDYYTRSFQSAMFEVPSPRNHNGIGWDGLPEWIFQLGLSKNEIAQLSWIEKLPEGGQNKNPNLDDGKIKEVQALLRQRQWAQAWKVLC